MAAKKRRPRPADMFHDKLQAVLGDQLETFDAVGVGFEEAEQIERSGFAVVSGRVSKVQRNSGGIWIELQDKVVLRVAPNLLDRFDATSLQALKGKQIEARGWVVDRSRRGGLKSGQARWLLPLTDTSMLQSSR